MKKRILFIIAFITSISLTAQVGGIRGRVVSESGASLPFAGILIKNANFNTSSNFDGIFELKLPTGDYEVLVQCMGYQTKIEKIKVIDEWVEVKIAMKASVYTLAEVEVKANNENPAYTIMRKAISLAAFYKNQIDEYSAKCYIRGNIKLTQIPWAIRKMMDEKDKNEIDKNNTYIIENISELSYKRPNIYKQKVISGKSNSPVEVPNAIEFVKGSFYEPLIAGSISPLSPKALAYYSFKLEGTTYEDNRAIYKIKVTPRSKGDKLFEGTIYIVDKLWCISGLSLMTKLEGISFIAVQKFSEIQTNVWMPLAQNYNVYGTIYGFGFDVNYHTALNQYKIKLNESLRLPTIINGEKSEEVKIIPAKSTSVKSQKEKDLEELLQSDKTFTKKDMRKVMKMYAKEEIKRMKDPENKVKDPDILMNSTVEIDSSAYKKDSAYWFQERAIPLTENEVQRYVVSDSMSKKIGEKKINVDSLAKSTKRSFTNTLEYKLNDRNKIVWKLFGGSVNTVEGLVFTTSCTYSSLLRNKKQFFIEPIIRYSLARNHFNGKGIATYQYGQNRMSGSVFVDLGNYINQFNSNNPISESWNTWTTIFAAQNYLKIYENEYYKLGFSQKITDNLYVSANTEYANRYMLDNNQKISEKYDSNRKSFTSNIPVNSEIASTAFPVNQAFTSQFTLNYYLGKKYSMRNGIKIEIDGATTDITLNYKKGWNSILSSDVDFDFIELGLSRKFVIGVRGSITAKVNSGGFLNNNKLYFMDFAHFMGNRSVLQQFDDGFRLMDYYNYSTHDYFAEGSLNLQPRKLLLTQFDFVRKYGLHESIRVHYLYTPSLKNYVELSYGIDNIFRFIKLEVASSFDNSKYRLTEFRIGISPNILNVFSKSSK